MTILEHVAKSKIIAVVRLDDLSDAVPLSEALLAGGVDIVEFTLTNPDAPRAIAEVRNILGDKVAVGAGSVITPEQVKQVADAGAQFVISPIVKADVVAACHEYNLPSMPGAYTPTEIQSAWEMDVAAVKIFPARNLGASYIKDVLAPLPHLRLIPTGGISASNITTFINAGIFAIGVGGALCDRTVIEAKDWASLSASANELREAIS